jgi:hypothetical protein
MKKYMNTIKLNSNNPTIATIKNIDILCNKTDNELLSSIYKDLRRNMNLITISDSVAEKALISISDISNLKSKDFKNIGKDFCDIYISHILSIIVSRNSERPDMLKFLVLNNKTSFIENVFYLNLNNMRMSISEDQTKEIDDNLNIQRGQILSIYSYIIKNTDNLNITNIGIKTNKKIGITNIKNDTKYKLIHMDIN